MEHMSRERISMAQRLELIREDLGPVSQDRGYITVCSYTWMLTVKSDSALSMMGLNDFKKMIRTVKKQLDPDYYYEYLRIWKDHILSKKSLICDDYHLKVDDRLRKMIAFINKEVDRLPCYVFEE